MCSTRSSLESAERSTVYQAGTVAEHRREQNRSKLFRWSRLGEYQAAVNLSGSPGTERVPLDLFNRPVPGNDVLAVPRSGVQEQRSGSSANGGGAAQSHRCNTAVANRMHGSISGDVVSSCVPSQR